MGGTIMKKRGLVALLIAVIAIGIAALVKREELARLMAVQSLFTEDKIVNNFSNMDQAFLTKTVSRGDGPISTLPIDATITLPDAAADYIADRYVTSLLVMKHGAIVYEDYLQGTGPDDLRISWSVAKSYLSSLFGVLVAEGVIDSIDQPVTDYAPSLAGGAYADATIKDVLQMSSGIVFDEDYFDFWSDINRMGRVLALGRSMDGFAEALTETFAEPGTDWQYTSIDTHVLGMVIRGATGRSVADLLSEKIIAPLGQERDALYLTDGYGVAFVLGGLNITTRDYARFGQMIAQNGVWQGEQIVPANWIAAATAPSAKTNPDETGYGYQWWIPLGSAPGQFLGRGIYGQYLYIDQGRDVVIVMTAGDRTFREPGAFDESIALFREIAESMDP